MEKKQNVLKNVIIAITSFCSSIVAIFTMYYLFATIAFVTAIIGLKNEETKSMSITSLIIVVVTLFIKVINTLIVNGSLPSWLTNGLI